MSSEDASRPSRYFSPSSAAAVLAAVSFVSALWAMIHLDPPARPGEDYDIQIYITPVSVGLLLAGILLVGLNRFLRKRAARRDA